MKAPTWCPSSVLIRDLDTGECVPVPCKRRRCGYCGPNIYAPRQRAKMLRMVAQMPRNVVKEMCVTAPGSDVLADGAAIDRWNAKEPECWERFIRLMRSRYADLEYVSVCEVQERGAIHRHVLAVEVSFIEMEFMRECAVRAGYGPRIQLQSASRRQRSGVWGAVGYITKYITKSLEGWNVAGRQPVTFSRMWARIVRLVRVKVGRWARVSYEEQRAWSCYGAADYYSAEGFGDG